MARPAGVANHRSLEFLRRFDEMAHKYVDPLELLFQVAAKHKAAGTGWEKGHRLTAAQTLLMYRYPRLKALEITENSSQTVQISWLDDDQQPLVPLDENRQPDLLN